MTEYPYEVPVVYTPGDNYPEVHEWALKNCKGKLLWKFILPGRGGVMKLELAEDVTIFSLRWGGHLKEINW